MRGDELIVLTRAEFEALKRKADGAAYTGELFSSEEMQAIREQYEERIAAVEERREELEWKLRLDLAKIRDAELHARRAADEMRRVELSLEALLAEGEDTQVRSVVPSPALQPVAPKPQVSVQLRKPVPPPLPPATPVPPPLKANGATGANGSNGTNGHANGNGLSNADKFRAAMANRKRYVA